MERAGSVMATRSLFQAKNGGSIPTPAHKIYQCDFEHIRYLFEAYHYKGGHMGGGITMCFALVDDSCDRIIGGAVIGALRHDKNYSKNGRRALEIRRMACEEDAPKNTESYFLGKILWWLKKYKICDDVISYADQSVGHKGIIYRAANFRLIGQTAPSNHVFWKGKRYHPRSLTIERPYSYELREAMKTGDAYLETGLPKLIFSYAL